MKLKRSISLLLCLVMLLSLSTAFAADPAVAPGSGTGYGGGGRGNGSALNNGYFTDNDTTHGSGLFLSITWASELMISACVAGDYATGDAACIARNEKIAAIESEYAPINFEDLWLISKIMYAEAGSEWLSDEWKMCVGEVVLNRVASPEFPNTLREVLEQPGQYYGKNSRYFKELLPSERCVRLAVRLLEGERVIDDPAVVFQANFTQGSGVHTKYYDKYLGWTYFCYSAHMSCYDR